MIRIYGCLTELHDLRLVLLAATVCLFTCFATLSLFARARDAAKRGRLSLLSGVAGVVFGSGIWATHFVAELAYKPGLPVGYDIGLTALSLAIATSIGWLGMVAAMLYGSPMVGGALLSAAIGGMHYVGMSALRVPASFQWDFRYVIASLAVGA